MSAETLRRAASLMRERAEAATEGVCPAWTAAAVRHIARNCDIDCEYLSCEHTEADDDAGRSGSAAGWGRYNDAQHIASWHPAVALAVADWLDAVAGVHWPKRRARPSTSHYNADPEHDYLAGDCDKSCWTEAFICNGCGTATCRPEITEHALAVARAYLGEVDA